MLKITRGEGGKHFVDSKIFDPLPLAGSYRKTLIVHAVQMSEAFSVETLEGIMEGKAGDWLMIGAIGELYPCDAEVFEMSYAPA